MSIYYDVDTKSHIPHYSTHRMGEFAYLVCLGWNNLDILSNDDINAIGEIKWNEYDEMGIIKNH